VLGCIVAIIQWRTFNRKVRIARVVQDENGRDGVDKRELRLHREEEGFENIAARLADAKASASYRDFRGTP
jgi:hypothetical protein